MAITQVSYTGPGNGGVYAIPFPYISPEHVICTVNGAAHTNVTWVTTSEIQVIPTPLAGDVVDFERQTPTTPLVVFADDARLDKANLDLALTQVRYIAEENGGGSGDTITGDEIVGGGGPTVSYQGVPVLADGAIPTDIDFTDTEMEPQDQGDGTVAVVVNSFGTGGFVKGRRTITTKTGDAMLALAEEGHAIHFENTLDATMTIPENSIVPIPIGAEFEITRIGTGAVSITAASGVLLNGLNGGSAAIAIQYGGAVVRKVSTNNWLVTGSIGAATVPFDLPVYLWADVFADHTGTAYVEGNDPGEDWTGWGTSEEQSIDIPLEWFMNNVLAMEAPEGAVFDLNSPTGTAWIKGRFQPPPRSVAKNYVLDFSGNDVLRGYDGPEGRWGQFFNWGLKAQDPAMESEAVIDADSAQGERVLYLRDDADTDALMSVAVYGSIIEIRTDRTKPNYHPESSRTTCFVESVDPVARTITVIDPLEIDVPRDNPLDTDSSVGWAETSDPSTVTLLQGSLIAVDTPAGSNTLTLSSTVGMSVGDWLLIRTNEMSGPGAHQFSDGVVPNFEPDIPDWNGNQDGSTPVPINEESHEIIAINGNVVTLKTALGKNKLTAWRASATKLDPIDGMTLIGGNMLGGIDGGGDAWEHQYMWCRYMVNSTIRDWTFDGRDKAALSKEVHPDSRRRVGQAVRCDNGDNNTLAYNWIGAPQIVGAGQGYGFSFRFGERNSVIEYNYAEGCRHSIEFWASSGGNMVRHNHTHNTTSSCIDTHGNWNTGITIMENLITRNAAEAAVSGDLGDDSEPDALRVGNNKFVFDENIQLINNRVIGFDGNGLSIVPGVHNVTVDGLEVNGCYRGINFASNTRQPTAFTKNVIIRNVTIDNWRDRPIYILKDAGDAIFDTLTIENLVMGGVGGAQIGNPYTDAIDGPFISGVDNLTLRNWEIYGPVREDAGDGRGDILFANIDNLVFDNVLMDGTAHGLGLLKDVTNISGSMTINNLTNTNLWKEWDNNNKSGTLTIYHNQPIGTNAGEVREEPFSTPSPLTITTVYQP